MSVNKEQVKNKGKQAPSADSGTLEDGNVFAYKGQIDRRRFAVSLESKAGKRKVRYLESNDPAKSCRFL